MSTSALHTPDPENLVNPHVWKEDELEHLGRCPVCSSSERILQYQGIPDLMTHTVGKWNYYHCLSCGVLYLDPRPDEKHIGYLYENYYTHTVQEKRKRKNWMDQLALSMRNDYLNKKFGYRNAPALPGGFFLMHLLPPWLRLEWDHFARHLPKAEPGKNRLLDVGCGSGEFLVAARSAGWHVTGIDFDHEAVLTARKQGADARVGSLIEQHFPDCSFDVITLSAVIEHVHNPKALLTECARVLKPNGLIWITTPNYASIVHKKFKFFWHYLCPEHLILFTSSTLQDTLESCNFTVKHEHRGLHFKYHWLASKAIREGHVDINKIYTESYANRKFNIRHWPVEFSTYINRLKQGDIVISGKKN